MMNKNNKKKHITPPNGLYEWNDKEKIWKNMKKIF